jgi:hypothetical protein
MIHDFYPVVPHPIVPSQIEPNRPYYVGDGDHFVIAVFAPYMWHRRNGKRKRGAWVHAASSSPWLDKPITIEPLYVLAIEEALVTAAEEDRLPGVKASSAPIDDDRWECGSDGMIAELALRLIVRNKIKSDFYWLEGQISAAGPRACRAMLSQLDDEGMPF